jgi:hypothetical protein
MTELEILYAQALYGDKIYDADLPHIQQIIHRTAYHEAAHYAARWFTMLEVTHVLTVSIKPQGYKWGIVTSERPFTRSGLASAIDRWFDGMTLLIMDLAGHCTDMILEQEDRGGASVIEYCLEEGMDDEGTDYDHAFKVANLMARPFMPAYRILFLAERWTREMLHIPAIWTAIERVAHALIKGGELSGDVAYDIVSDIDPPTIFSSGYSRWRRRLFRQRDKEMRKERAEK